MGELIGADTRKGPNGLIRIGCPMGSVGGLKTLDVRDNGDLLKNEKRRVIERITYDFW